MGKITVKECPIKGLYTIQPTVYGDERGYFVETYNQKDMIDAGLDMVFVQDNQSMSKKGVLRGLHFQKQFPQGKLVRVIKGEVFDVAVDLRKDSETYGKWHGEILSAENMKQFYIFALKIEDAKIFKINDEKQNSQSPKITYDPDGVMVWNGKRCESEPATPEEIAEMEDLLSEFK